MSDGHRDIRPHQAVVTRIYTASSRTIRVTVEFGRQTKYNEACAALSRAFRSGGGVEGNWFSAGTYTVDRGEAQYQLLLERVRRDKRGWSIRQLTIHEIDLP